ncbi:Methionyl-tRNA formyltransferase [bioreactor metagenome]|uniref:methionyl-tRNA formyltransferase n=1 Tax=bioreactor metagenome TaxID=1076179 RepID=A0A644X3Q6_9ZZZZ
MRILFMGTPAFAVPSLAALYEAGHEICGVFTQPDKPKNRGMKLFPTPVKEYAITHDIPVFQPLKLRDGTALAQIKALAPDLIVVAAYGRLLPDDILACPLLGCINVHSSLLPKYRGAAPINWAVLKGERETGVTIMYMASELDAGDIIEAKSTPIDPDETAETLHDTLALMGAALLTETVGKISSGMANRTPQDHSRATLAPMLSRELSPMDWNREARQLHNQVRGLIPWPAATAVLGGTRCKVLKTRVLDEATNLVPGTVISAGKHGIHMACGGGTVLSIDRLQADGGKPLDAGDYLRGHKIIG